MQSQVCVQFMVSTVQPDGLQTSFSQPSVASPLPSSQPFSQVSWHLPPTHCPAATCAVWQFASMAQSTFPASAPASLPFPASKPAQTSAPVSPQVLVPASCGGASPAVQIPPAQYSPSGQCASVSQGASLIFAWQALSMPQNWPLGQLSRLSHGAPVVETE